MAAKRGALAIQQRTSDFLDVETEGVLQKSNSDCRYSGSRRAHFRPSRSEHAVSRPTRVCSTTILSGKEGLSGRAGQASFSGQEWTARRTSPVEAVAAGHDCDPKSSSGQRTVQSALTSRWSRPALLAAERRFESDAIFRSDAAPSFRMVVRIRMRFSVRIRMRFSARIRMRLSARIRMRFSARESRLLSGPVAPKDPHRDAEGFDGRVVARDHQPICSSYPPTSAWFDGSPIPSRAARIAAFLARRQMSTPTRDEQRSCHGRGADQRETQGQPELNHGARAAGADTE